MSEHLPVHTILETWGIHSALKEAIEGPNERLRDLATNFLKALWDAYEGNLTGEEITILEAAFGEIELRRERAVNERHNPEASKI